MPLSTEEAQILDDAVNEATIAPPDAFLNVPARLILALHQEFEVATVPNATMTSAILFGFVYGTLFGWVSMIVLHRCL